MKKSCLINPYQGILVFLEKYAGKPYSNPNTLVGASQISMLQLHALGHSAGTCFKEKVKKILSITGNKLMNYRPARWLETNARYVRYYLWAELKTDAKRSLPYSISLFARSCKFVNKNINAKSCFEICIEFFEAGATDAQVRHYYQYILDPQNASSLLNKGFVYSGVGKGKGDIYIFNTIKEAQNAIDNAVTSHLRLSKYFISGGHYTEAGYTEADYSGGRYSESGYTEADYSEGRYSESDYEGVIAAGIGDLMDFYENM